MADALKKADEKEAARKKAEQEEKDAIEVPEESDKLELPWTFDELKTQMPIGMTVTYQLSGTNDKGKDVSDTWTATLRVNTDDEVGANAFRDSEKDSPLAKQVARHEWARTSPFFWVEKAETTVDRREKVTVPAGEFDCVVAEQKGFFGAHLTVWMIPDKPGVYAKVVDHGNANEEEDETELVYELTKIDMPAE